MCQQSLDAGFCEFAIVDAAVAVHHWHLGVGMDGCKQGRVGSWAGVCTDQEMMLKTRRFRAGSRISDGP